MALIAGSSPLIVLSYADFISLRRMRTTPSSRDFIHGIWRPIMPTLEIRITESPPVDGDYEDSVLQVPPRSKVAFVKTTSAHRVRGFFVDAVTWYKAVRRYFWKRRLMRLLATARYRDFRD